MSHKLLVTRPNFDLTTRYISIWAKKIIELAKEKGRVVLDLEKNRANRKEFESMIIKHEPELLFLNGHGNDDVVTGQDEEVLLRAKENDALLKSKIVYALSCRSGKTLVPSSVNFGANAYIGYDEDFIFLYDEKQRTRPERDKTAELFLDSSNQVMVSLLKNHSPKEARDYSKQAYIKRVKKLLSSQSTASESSAVRYLIWDVQHLVCWEKNGSVIVKR